MPEKAPFVVFEGPEGAGKTTQVRLLSEWLERRRVPHVAVREPGGTELGEAVRRLLLESADMPDRAELFLMLAARHQEAIDVGRQALEMAQTLGLDHVRALVMNNIGTARSAMGDREGLRELQASIDVPDGDGSA
jgi:thymidylate kinase